MPKRKNNKKVISNKNKNKNKIIININSNNKKKVINSKKNNSSIPTNQPILISNPGPQPMMYPQFLPQQQQPNQYMNTLSKNEFGLGVSKLLDAIEGGASRISQTLDQNLQDSNHLSHVERQLMSAMEARQKEISDIESVNSDKSMHVFSKGEKIGAYKKGGDFTPYNFSELEAELHNLETQQQAPNLLNYRDMSKNTEHLDQSSILFTRPPGLFAQRYQNALGLTAEKKNDPSLLENQSNYSDYEEEIEQQPFEVKGEDKREDLPVQQHISEAERKKIKKEYNDRQYQLFKTTRDEYIRLGGRKPIGGYDKTLSGVRKMQDYINEMT